MSNVERVCKVCGRPEREAGPLMVAADDGVIVRVASRQEVHPGDLICWRHTAIRADGNYVRLEDGG